MIIATNLIGAAIIVMGIAMVVNEINKWIDNMEVEDD